MSNSFGRIDRLGRYYTNRARKSHQYNFSWRALVEEDGVLIPPRKGQRATVFGVYNRDDTRDGLTWHLFDCETRREAIEACKVLRAVAKGKPVAIERIAESTVARQKS